MQAASAALEPDWWRPRPRQNPQARRGFSDIAWRPAAVPCVVVIPASGGSRLCGAGQDIEADDRRCARGGAAAARPAAGRDSAGPLHSLTDASPWRSDSQPSRAPLRAAASPEPSEGPPGPRDAGGAVRGPRACCTGLHGCALRRPCRLRISVTGAVWLPSRSLCGCAALLMNCGFQYRSLTTWMRICQSMAPSLVVSISPRQLVLLDHFNKYYTIPAEVRPKESP